MNKPSREYVAKHRAKKSAEAFAENFMGGVKIATPDEFIGAKLAEIGAKYFCTASHFDYDLIEPFHTCLIDNFVEENGRYGIFDLMTAWTKAEKSL